MYWVDVWHFRGSIEYEYKHAGNYGAKGEKRAKRRKATPEEVRRQNQRNREKNVRRLIKANFASNDYWVTLKYPKGERPGIEEVKRHMKGFLDKVRRGYKKRGGGVPLHLPCGGWEEGRGACPYPAEPHHGCRPAGKGRLGAWRRGLHPCL